MYVNHSVLAFQVSHIILYAKSYAAVIIDEVRLTKCVQEYVIDVHVTID